MGKQNILLLCGGGGTEHEISLISAKHFFKTLVGIENLNVIQIEICKNGDRLDHEGNLCELRKSGEVFYPHSSKTIKINFVIPCFHGPPGETGEIQAIFEQMRLPYFGSSCEASIICFNKVTTKLYLDSLGVPNTPFIFLYNEDELEKANNFLESNKTIFVKASNQGSSVGCYKVSTKEDLKKTISNAFELSPYVLLETAVSARELEVATYELNGQIVATHPGEIICPDGFYTYEEKYDAKSHTSTNIKAKGLTDLQLDLIKKLSLKVFKALKLRDLARIDFFLTEDGEVLLNEINTFPGMTPISMFPKMLEANGDSFTQFLNEKIQNRSKKD